MSSFFDNDSFLLDAHKSSISTFQFPIRSAASILKQKTYQPFLKIIQTILSKELYHKYYLPAITQFVEYAQALPAREQGLFSEKQGLIDYSLSRATYTLTFALAHLYPKEKNFLKMNEQSIDALNLYTAFTAALFMNIGQLLRYYSITLHSKEKNTNQLWNPFQGAMCDKKFNYSSYSFKYIESHFIPYLCRGALVSRILDKGSKTNAGFNWLISHLEVYESWLALLDEEETNVPFSAVMELIPFADRHTVEARLRKFKHQLQRATNLFYDRKYSTEEKRIPNDLGERFLQWIQAQLAEGKLPVNHKNIVGLRRSRQGILIAKMELEKFSQLYQLDATIVEKQFKELVALYPTSVNERGRQSSAMGGTSQIALEKWLTVYNPALIFSIGRVPPFFLTASQKNVMQSSSPYHTTTTHY